MRWLSALVAIVCLGLGNQAYAFGQDRFAKADFRVNQFRQAWTLRGDPYLIPEIRVVICIQTAVSVGNTAISKDAKSFVALSVDRGSVDRKLLLRHISIIPWEEHNSTAISSFYTSLFLINYKVKAFGKSKPYLNVSCRTPAYIFDNNLWMKGFAPEFWGRAEGAKGRDISWFQVYFYPRTLVSQGRPQLSLSRNRLSVTFIRTVDGTTQSNKRNQKSGGRELVFTPFGLSLPAPELLLLGAVMTFCGMIVAFSYSIVFGCIICFLATWIWLPGFVSFF